MIVFLFEVKMIVKRRTKLFPWVLKEMNARKGEVPIALRLNGLFAEVAFEDRRASS